SGCRRARRARRRSRRGRRRSRCAPYLYPQRPMESYPLGASGGVHVEVRRDERAEEGFAGFSVCLAVDDGSFVVRLPGHYGAELAARLRGGEDALARGGRGARRTYRDEYLDLTALPAEEALVLS